MFNAIRQRVCAQSKPVKFDPVEDIPSLEGKVILVTGANAGLGKQSVLELARHNPRQIWLGSRSLEKARLAIEDIQKHVPNASDIIKPLELDLSSFASVKKAADTFLAESMRLDILILNAGIMATPTGLSKDGYEIQWATNHMGHAMLTRLLLPALTATVNSNPGADVRIVSVSSHGHTGVPKGGFRFDMLKNTADELGPYGRYFQTKLANVLFARQMAKLHPEFTIAAVHPGVVQTELLGGATGAMSVMFRAAYSFTATVEKGVRNQLWAAVSKDVNSGEYYTPVGVRGETSEDGLDDVLAEKVWNWTDKELSSWLAALGDEK